MAGFVSIPAMNNWTNGVPSVDATAIPPWLAVLSLEISLPNASVLYPRTISGSLTTNSWTLMNAVVPPSVMFPVTFKLRSIWTSRRTFKSWGTVNWLGILNVGVELSPVPPVTVIWFEVPVIDWT